VLASTTAGGAPKIVITPETPCTQATIVFVGLGGKSPAVNSARPMSASPRERHVQATSTTPVPKLQNASDIIHPWRVSWYSLMR
jgi:hypothetical protein